MNCQYTHLDIGKSLTLQVHSYTCIHCGTKVPGEIKTKATYRGHKTFTPSKFHTSSSTPEILTDWFSIPLGAFPTCECGKHPDEIYWQCKGDWYLSFIEAIEKIMAPITASLP